MRATINFEVDVDQVENTMATLVAMESDTLRAIADMIDVNPGPRTMVLEEVTEALRLMQETSTQLQQYRDMLISFEQAKFETILPQAAPVTVPVTADATPPTGVPAHLLSSLNDIKEAVGNMQEFDGFLEKISLPAVPEEEVPDGTEEG
jgi:hypothetical protein